MLRGLYKIRIDGRGRVTVPGKFCEQFSVSGGPGCVVITNFLIEDTPGLDVYPLAAWKALEERTESHPEFDQSLLTFRAHYVAGALECAIDKRNRLYIPARLREFAGLQRDIVVVGMLSIFRIFDIEAWDTLH